MALTPKTAVKTLVEAAIAVIIVSLFLNLSFAGSAAVNASVDDPAVLDTSIDRVPKSVTVKATRGNALAFDGDDAVESTAPENLTEGSWSVCAAAELDDGANPNATYDVFAYANESLLLQYDAGYWSVYYNNSTASGKATIEAPNASDGLTKVCARYNATSGELVVARDGTISSPSALNTNVTERNLSSSWQGRLDEIRAFHNANPNSTTVAYADDPIKPLEQQDRAARWMFDEGEGSETTAYFAGEESTIVGATWTDGIPGGEVPSDSYSLSGEPFTLHIESGGYLVGAPVEYVSWDANRLPFDIVRLGGILLALAILATIASRIAL